MKDQFLKQFKDQLSKQKKIIYIFSFALIMLVNPIIWKSDTNKKQSKDLHYFLLDYLVQVNQPLQMVFFENFWKKETEKQLSWMVI